jgi:predicted RNase H-like HicB family nuclease
MIPSADYLKAARRRVRYEHLEDGEWFASIPGFPGLWATGSSVANARAQLIETLYEWLAVHTMIGQNPLLEWEGSGI